MSRNDPTPPAMRLVVAIAGLTLAGALAVAPVPATAGVRAPDGSREPVLGMLRHTRWAAGAVGWGRYAPREVYNGGDPSGLVESIRWHHWGQHVALGFGRTAIFRPSGGYYRRMVEAELRPSDLGHCARHGPLAYRHLDAREPSTPGGPLGRGSAGEGGGRSVTRGRSAHQAANGGAHSPGRRVAAASTVAVDALLGRYFR